VARKVTPDQKVHKVIQELTENQGPLVNKALKDPQVPQARKERRVTRVIQVNPGNQGIQEHRDHKVLRDRQDNRDKWDHLEVQVNADHRDKMDHGVRRVLMDHEVYKDHLEMLVCRAHQVKADLKVTEEILDDKVHLVVLEHEENLGWLVKRVRKEQMDLRDHLDELDKRVTEERKVIKE
jgi:hypothetical protein